MGILQTDFRPIQVDSMSEIYSKGLGNVFDKQLARLQQEEQNKRADALFGMQQAQEQRTADKYNQELADRTFAEKTFAAYNQTPTRDYSALPTQLTGTEKGKSVINDMSLTAEELANPTMPSAIAKMKNQQILSDTHDKSGQTLLESERFKAAMASTAKGADGMIPLSMQERLLGMESAERAAMTAKSERAQKAAELLSKDRSELQRAGLKDATTLAAAEIKAAEGKGGGAKKDSKDNIPKWEDYKKLEEGLNSKYSFWKLGDAESVAAVTSAAAAAKMSPDELYGIVSGEEVRGLDNKFNKDKVLAAIAAKKPVLTGADNGSTTRAPGRFALLDPMAGYGELLKQKDAEYRQAVANTANIPLTQADVIEGRVAKGALQLDELIARLKAVENKKESSPETKDMPAPEIKKEESKKVIEKVETGVNKDGTISKSATNAINDLLKSYGGKLPEVKLTVDEATAIINNVTREKPFTNVPIIIEPPVMSPEAKTVKDRTDGSILSTLTLPFRTIGDAYTKRWGKTEPDQRVARQIAGVADKELRSVTEMIDPNKLKNIPIDAKGNTRYAGFGPENKSLMELMRDKKLGVDSKTMQNKAMQGIKDAAMELSLTQHISYEDALQLLIDKTSINTPRSNISTTPDARIGPVK